MFRRFTRFWLFFGIGSLVALFLFIFLAPIPANKGSATSSARTSLATVQVTNVTSANGTSSGCPAPLDTVTPCLTPQAIRTSYGIEPLIAKGFTGKGQTIVLIVSFGSSTLKDDMDVYDQTFGLPPIDLQIVDPLQMPENDTQNTKSAWASVTTLSVQVIHAIAPEAKVVVMTSPVGETQGTIGLAEFRLLAQYAIDHHLGNIILQNWNVSEPTLQIQSGQEELQRWNDLYKQATTQKGITFLAASGDNGATDYADLNSQTLASTPTVDFPATSPWVTAVGGTTLVVQSTGRNEQAWSGSGGGYSTYFQLPDYQKTLPSDVVQPMKGHRGIPDVAAAASLETGLMMYSASQWKRAGGTSVSASIWAGIIAIANQMVGRPLGYINPSLYKLAASNGADFHDITDGNNTNQKASVEGYPAVAGWDPVTGLGAPDAQKLLADLAAPV
jgi:subtilase family serine protease